MFVFWVLTLKFLTRLWFEIPFLLSLFSIDYRSSTIRKKRWSPELEQKIKHAFNVIKNKDEAVQYLMKLGLTAHEIELVLQHFLSYTDRNQRFQRCKENNSKNETLSTPPSSTYARAPLSIGEQQLELIGFTQSVSNSLLFFFPLSNIFSVHTVYVFVYVSHV